MLINPGQVLMMVPKIFLKTASAYCEMLIMVLLCGTCFPSLIIHKGQAVLDIIFCQRVLKSEPGNTLIDAMTVI